MWLIIRSTVPLALLLAVMLTATSVSSAATLTPLATFGNGDGFRAPFEVVAGDTAGTADAFGYFYLRSNLNPPNQGSQERSFAYNPATGNLVLVSRNPAANGIRVLNGTTGADTGSLNQGTGIISGGTFTTNTVGAADDGAVYVANLVTNVSTTAFRVYRWTSEGAAAPTVFFNSTIAGFSGTPRLGDDMDVTGSGASTRLAYGVSGGVGYAVIDGAGAASAIASFVPAGPLTGDLRLGITFAGSSADVWGKQTGGSAATAPLRLTSYSGTSGASLGSATLTSGGEAAMDYAVIGGVPYLAVVNMNTAGSGLPTVTVYDMTNPLLPVSVVSGTTASGLTTTNNGNGNATGSVRWGAISGLSATLYAMSTNQGIQAFTFLVPEPSCGLLVCAAAAFVNHYRRRLKARG